MEKVIDHDSATILSHDIFPSGQSLLLEKGPSSLLLTRRTNTFTKRS